MLLIVAISRQASAKQLLSCDLTFIAVMFGVVFFYKITRKCYFNLNNLIMAKANYYFTY